MTRQTRRRPRLGLLVTVIAALVPLVMACVEGDGTDKDAKAEPYPILPTDNLVDVGKPLYEANCASCHGDATTAPPLEAAPAHTDEGHTWHHPDRLLAEWILDGVPLATVMPRWRGKLSEDEVRAVLAYVKMFWSEERRNQQIEGSRQYEAQIREFGQ